MTDTVPGQVNGYTLAPKQDFEDFQAFCLESEGWNVCYEATDVKVWDKSVEGSAINIVKLWGTLPVSPAVCYDVLHDPDYRKVWDENMSEGYNIEVLDAYNDVGYYAAKSPFFAIAGRDFCNQRSWWVAEDLSNYLIINHSVEHEKCPPQKSFVRAKSIRTGYWLRPAPDNADHTEIIYLTQTDLMGMIPTWIVNKATKTFAPRLIENLIRVGPKYNEWKSANEPDKKPWLGDNQPYWWESVAETKIIVCSEGGESGSGSGSEAEVVSGGGTKTKKKKRSKRSGKSSRNPSTTTSPRAPRVSKKDEDK